MNVGIVAIGRNEGERLRTCLLSALRDCKRVVYVDSGSVDGSIELARSLGVEVVSLDLTTPFTAARARNEGFERLREIAGTTDFVQFVDADCEIIDGWISAATAAMTGNPRVAVVSGRLRERFPGKSIYNRLCDMEWDSPSGETTACGGNALMRASAFMEAGGFDAGIIAGEEPELCFRLRSKSWKILRIDADMALHDAAMTRLSQWWRRNVRSGHAYAEGNALHGGPPEYFRKREVRSIEFWTLCPVLSAVILVMSIALVRPAWCWLGLAPLMMYPVLAMKIALGRMRNGQSGVDAFIYGTFLVFGKFPQHVGIRTFRKAKRSGRRSAIIEYKAPVSRSNQLAVQAGHDAA